MAAHAELQTAGLVASVDDRQRPLQDAAAVVIAGVAVNLTDDGGARTRPRIKGCSHQDLVVSQRFAGKHLLGIANIQPKLDCGCDCVCGRISERIWKKTWQRNTAATGFVTGLVK